MSPRELMTRDLSELLDRLATTQLTGHLTGQQLVSLMNYLIQAGDTDYAEAFVSNLALKVPQHEEALMTIAQQLEQQGIEKGIQLGEQKGLEKGLQLGEQKGRRDIAVKLPESGMSLKSVKEMTGLSEEDLAEIRH